METRHNNATNAWGMMSEAIVNMEKQGITNPAIRCKYD